MFFLNIYPTTKDYFFDKKGKFLPILRKYL